MKITSLAFMGLSIFLLMNEQAEAIGYQISPVEYPLSVIDEFHESFPSKTHYLYPGEYKMRIFLGNDNLGCSLRVGTKSSNTNLMKLSGPLAVRNVTNPISFLKGLGDTMANLADVRKWKFRFMCETTGTTTVSPPPTVTVPVLLTLTYGPFLTTTVPVLLTQKVGIKSVAASPIRRTYSLGQTATLHVNFTRKALNYEYSHRSDVYLRVQQGKLCVGSYASLEAGNEWKRLGSVELDGQPLTLPATLCESGQTIVEFKLAENSRFDSTIKRLVFNVDKRAPLRSRGIETLPPLVIPDPEPPVLPNFELQGEKP
ncbi:MAG: hypothetical protein OEY80_14430 [Nitrospirota bacterium]|nr:hypothetical protein [Nitrospirota bacterium]MDH4361404.1 hypothetical protein [Nitrospirota bacterium]MDH5576679.1 hypothetical protein [Nitrospirota bacterium]